MSDDLAPWEQTSETTGDGSFVPKQPANTGGLPKKPKRPTDRRPTEDDLRAELENAPPAPPLDGGAPPPPPADQGDGPPERGRKSGEIFEGSPVLALGVRGDYHYFLDALGQLRASKDLKREFCKSLYGNQLASVINRFPIWYKDAETGAFERKEGKFDHDGLSNAMYAACADCGLINPDNAVRGVGAWTNDDGQLVYHLGDCIMVGEDTLPPGRHDGKVYPAFAALPHPIMDPKAPDPVPDLMKTLSTWNWARQDTDPFLTLGMICVQIMGGALDWRPVFWLTAAAGSGKSELQKLVKYLHGDNGLVQSTDATKSGITSRLGQSSLPVAIDEAEPGHERSTKEADLIALARVAASGGEWFRGTADQSGVGGKVFSAFLFSSILIPGIMKTQDVQRLVRLDLKPLDAQVAKLNLQPRTWRARGARLKGILVKRWHNWPERLSVWRTALEDEGVLGRDADNWGTVLAMADMATNEDLPSDETLTIWCKRLAFVAAAGREDVNNDAEAMLLHLMGQPFDVHRRGELFTVAQWIMAAAGLPGAPTGLKAGGGEFGAPDEREKLAARREANEKLAKAGLRVDGVDQDASLFIANSQIHGLELLFRSSEWKGGAWKDSAARVPGATKAKSPRTLAGIRTRGTLIPVKSIPGLLGFPMDQNRSDRGPEGPDDLEDFA